MNRLSADDNLPKYYNTISKFLKITYHSLSSLFTLLIFGTAVFSTFAQAQISDTIPPDSIIAESIEYAFLPALAYNSDLGLVGGGIMSRYHFKKNEHPFHSYLIVNAIASTKGLLSSSVFIDKPKVFDSELRMTSDFYISRFLQNQYYGIGNYAKLAGEPDYYYYKSFSTGFEFILRKPLLMINTESSQLDAYGTANFDYRTPFGNNTDRFISEDAPLGINGIRTAALGTGLIWENRDNEFAPTRGTYAKAGIKISQKLIGSSANYLKFESEGRAYTSFTLMNKVTFANRISFTHTSGTLPYWQLAEIGGEATMRGYPENRFRDDNALFLNSELRTWFLEFPAYEVRLGGTLFADIGNTFSNGTAFKNIFKDPKYSFGFGGNSSFFNENFIFRGDVGFSDEGYGVYFTAGYMF